MANLDELYQQHFDSVIEKLNIEYNHFKESFNPPRTEQFITNSFIQKLIKEKDQLLYHIDDRGMHLISAKDLLISRFNIVKDTFIHSPYQNFFDLEDYEYLLNSIEQDINVQAQIPEVKRKSIEFLHTSKVDKTCFLAKLDAYRKYIDILNNQSYNQVDNTAQSQLEGKSIIKAQEAKTEYTQARADKLSYYILEVGCGGFQVDRSSYQYEDFLCTLAASPIFKSQWSLLPQYSKIVDYIIEDKEDLIFIREKLASIKPKPGSLLEEIVKKIDEDIQLSKNQNETRKDNTFYSENLKIINYSSKKAQTKESGKKSQYTQPRSDKLLHFILEVGCGGFQEKKSSFQYKQLLHTITANPYVNKDSSRWTSFFKGNIYSEEYLEDIEDLEFIRGKLASIQPWPGSVLEAILRNIEEYIDMSD